MLPGIFNRKFILLSSFLFIAAMTANAQFSHRFELMVEKSFSTQSDHIELSKDYIHFFEKTERTGGGTFLGLKYNLRDYPVSFILGYENNSSAGYTIDSDIQVSDAAQELNIQSADFNIQYVFFNHSTFKPSVFGGLNVNAIDYSRTGILYNYSSVADNQYIQVDEIRWGYQSIQSSFTAPGINFGTGLNIRLSDQIGISGNLKFRYIPQKQTPWIDRQIFIKTFSIGVYYRLSKRKNNLS